MNDIDYVHSRFISMHCHCFKSQERLENNEPNISYARQALIDGDSKIIFFKDKSVLVRFVYGQSFSHEKYNAALSEILDLSEPLDRLGGARFELCSRALAFFKLRADEYVLKADKFDMAWLSFQLPKNQKGEYWSYVFQIMCFQHPRKNDYLVEREILQKQLKPARPLLSKQEKMRLLAEEFEKYQRGEKAFLGKQRKKSRKSKSLY